MSTLDKPLYGKALKESNRKESIESLKNLFDGDLNPLVHTVTRHVSASGMTRDISLLYVKGGHIFNITYSAALALEWPLSEKSGNRAIRVSGTGMDMGFHTVYTLSRVLYGQDITDGDAGYHLVQAWL
jgi:hypothetical protein